MVHTLLTKEASPSGPDEVSGITEKTTYLLLHKLTRSPAETSRKPADAIGPLSKQHSVVMGSALRLEAHVLEIEAATWDSCQTCPKSSQKCRKPDTPCAEPRKMLQTRVLRADAELNRARHPLACCKGLTFQAVMGPDAKAIQPPFTPIIRSLS